jgi:dimethylargininase
MIPAFPVDTYLTRVCTNTSASKGYGNANRRRWVVSARMATVCPAGYPPAVPSPTIALTRRPPRSYQAFYAARDVIIDLVRTDAQYAAYIKALRAAGLGIETIDPDERFADSVFIEDTAIVWQQRALRTRMAVHREGEQSAVIAHLQRRHEIVTLPPGATLDGGDVLHTTDLTYVGRSSRTNAAGAAAVRDFLAPRQVVEVPVDRCLHLKSAATWLGNGTLLAALDLIDVSGFDVARVMFTAPGEDKAANTLRIGDRLLMLNGYPATAATLREFAAEHRVRLSPLDMSEFEKGDGSLTCLSILL